MPLAGFPKCYLSELCETRTMSVEEWIDMSSALDIDGHEFYWLFTPETKSGRRDLLSRVKDQGRSIPMMCYSPDFTKPDRAGSLGGGGSGEAGSRFV